MSTPAPDRPEWRKDVEVLYDPTTIARRITELGKQITADYAGRELCLVGILKGSFLFFSDLARAIDLPLTCEFMGISSYGDGTTSSGVVQITTDLSHSVEGRHVVLVEDIVDTGLTMRYLLDNFATRRPASLQICTLLHKPDNTRAQVPLAYVGFTIPNRFVVGYGLDLAGKFRNLPFIGVYHGNA